MDDLWPIHCHRQPSLANAHLVTYINGHNYLYPTPQPNHYTDPHAMAHHDPNGHTYRDTHLPAHGNRYGYPHSLAKPNSLSDHHAQTLIGYSLGGYPWSINGSRLRRCARPGGRC